jgi:hypothetical protein
VPVLEGARALLDGGVHVIAAEHRPDRGIAGPEPLGRRDDVGLDR